MNGPTLGPFFLTMKILNTKKLKAEYVLTKLVNTYPNPPIPLNHTSNYTLLIAVLLSAQCTDERVNKVTPALFKAADTPFKMIKLSVAKIEEFVKSCGLAPRKSRAIWELSQLLLQHFGGVVPDNFKDLESLPGVGHKTASVVMSQAFAVPAFAVDTHIHRLAQRWGLTNGKNVVQTEKDLKKLFPQETWNDLHLQFIYWGREFCSARGCDGRVCNICQTLYPKRSKPFIHQKA